jgi:hypothetical protein
MNKELLNPISEIYKNKTNELKSSNSTSYIIFVLIIFIIVIVYFLIEYNRKAILLDWNNNKCNPKYMFISGFIQNDVKDGIQYTYDNFVECINRSEPIKQEVKNYNTQINNLIDDYQDVYSYGIDQSRNETIEKNLERQMNRHKEYKNDTEKILNVMDLIYTQHQRLYNVMDMYINRTIYVVNNIYRYVGNALLYKLYKYKQQMNIDKFHKDIKIEYQNIINSDVTNAYNKYNTTKSQPNPETLDYRDSINKASSATNRLLALKKKIDDFNKSNNVTKEKINQVCTVLHRNPIFSSDNINCERVFNNYVYS